MPKPTASFRVSFAEHPEFGTPEDYVLTDVDTRDGFTGYGVQDLVNVLPEVLRQACVKAAAKFVDYENHLADGGNDSSYLNLCDKLGLGFQPTAVVPLLDAERTRFRCNGTYPNSDDGWSGLVYGTNPDEARFQAKWAMAIASAGDTKSYDDFACLMDGCVIDHVAPEPVTIEELADAARALLSEGPGGQAAERVTEMLQKLGIEAAPPGMRM